MKVKYVKWNKQPEYGANYGGIKPSDVTTCSHGGKLLRLKTDQCFLTHCKRGMSAVIQKGCGHLLKTDQWVGWREGLE